MIVVDPTCSTSVVETVRVTTGTVCVDVATVVVMMLPLTVEVDPLITYSVTVFVSDLVVVKSAFVDVLVSSGLVIVVVVTSFFVVREV